MVTAKTVNNIVLDSGGTNELTVYTTKAEKIYSKQLVKITSPQSTSNWGAGPKDTKIVDLLRVELRYSINGYINSADESKMENLVKIGGTINMTYKSETFTINIEKISIINDNVNEQDETSIMFTAVAGVNL